MDSLNLGSGTMELITTYGVRVVGVLAALFVAWVVAGWVRRLMMRGFQKSNFDPTLSKFFSNMARYALLTFAVLGCLGVFGIETSSFAAVIAAAGLAIGLAFQGTLSNFSAGVMLLIFRPFKVGEVVNVSGVTGSVEEIDLFTTELKTPDAKRIILPNSSVFGATITNFTHHEHRRVDVAVGTDYGADIDETRKILEMAARKVPGTTPELEPQVFLSSLGASSVDWQLRVWCKPEDYWTVWEATVREAKIALDGASIGIPFPQMDLHLDSAVVDALGARATKGQLPALGVTSSTPGIA
ncbi:MAG: mechanosensitive ion channel domain-containing protein [Myxococcota bacterium]|nr:mechanosensitive ion channel domain-containing protein [Myxococcota bacterium]